MEKALLARSSEGKRIWLNYPATNRVTKRKRKGKTVDDVKSYVGLDGPTVQLLCDILVKEDAKINPNRR